LRVQDAGQAVRIERPAARHDVGGELHDPVLVLRERRREGALVRQLLLSLATARRLAFRPVGFLAAPLSHAHPRLLRRLASEQPHGVTPVIDLRHNIG
jgi:hypothetical protein